MDDLRYIGRYLNGSKEEGIYLDPKQDKSFECWVNMDFLGQYVKAAPDMSRMGFLIIFVGCPILWGSKL
jgi:hypothetical protein